jgi:Recombinase zinc beta ribbon domain
MLGHCAAGGRTIPSGVTWDVKTKTWGYDQVYAPKIAEAFRMVARGETNLSYIIKKLNLYLRPSQGAPKLANCTSLRRLLENRMFIGERVIDKKFDLTVPKEQLMHVGRDGKLHKRNRPAVAREAHEVIVRQVISPGLVDPKTFTKVQTILRGKSDQYRQMHALHTGKSKFVYGGGLLTCGECGQPLYTVSTGKRRIPCYRCRDHFPKKGSTGVCKAPTMKQDRLEVELDRVFSHELTRNHFYTELFKKHAGAESRKDTSRRRARLEARQKALAEKRERIIEFALEGVYDQSERDRRLQPVLDERAANQRLLDDLVETPLPTLDEWQYLMQPFRRGFAGLPADEKRRLITSRFQNIRVKNYRVVSLYLLTGDIVKPSEHEEVDPTKCYGCGHRVSESKRISWQGTTMCAECAEHADYEASESRSRVRLGRTTWEDRIHAGVLTRESTANTVNDSSHRL